MLTQVSAGDTFGAIRELTGNNEEPSRPDGPAVNVPRCRLVPILNSWVEDDQAELKPPVTIVVAVVSLFVKAKLGSSRSSSESPLESPRFTLTNPRCRSEKCESTFTLTVDRYCTAGNRRE